YIKGTINYGVKFHKCQKFRLNGFSNSDWGGALDMSTSDFCFNFGSFFLVFQQTRYSSTINNREKIYHCNNS
uniref:Uncharacterized protein n=1 Tax=Solanum lycopersicum TaxID=4081 RepID=A0A3Q7IHM2_SOLLC